ncbi:flagellar biosynthesis anti-sigma factor FlgM [Paenibacillus koleovorans]|uniref:flagellar biosynthesis anti-sigma factor FlgM n=1 Tax=Paenibacillus koleovorans TaxID=121608 RepID=UPI000FD95B69|nr:flagellar biosynthesis anti-sigma factor FlgM [Paenibacillus koleovorans]
MKINGISRVGGTNPYQRNQETRTGEARAKERQKDEVRISTEAQELLESQSGTGAVSHRERLQQLKQQVSTGTYTVEAGRLADKLWPFLK